MLLKTAHSQGPIGIIFAPARELCIQIYHEVQLYNPSSSNFVFVQFVAGEALHEAPKYPRQCHLWRRTNQRAGHLLDC